MTIKGMDPKDLPTTERKSAAKLSTEQIEQVVALLNEGQVATDDRTYKTEGAARRNGLQLRKAVLDAHPKLAVTSRVWADGDKHRSGIVLKDEPKVVAAAK